MRITRHPLLFPATALRDIPLDESVVVRLERGFEILAPRAGEIVRRVRLSLRRSAPRAAELLEANVAPVTTMTTVTTMHGEDGTCLLALLRPLVENLRRRDALREHVEAIAAAHVDLLATPGAAAAALAALDDAIVGACGPDLADEVAAEWRRALELLADATREATRRRGDVAGRR